MVRRFTPSLPSVDAARRLRATAASRLGVDVRALAALRLSLGLLLLADLAVRARDLTAFYTDAGVLPRAVLREQYPVAATVSLHALSGAPWWQACLFALAGLAAAALVLGYRTRLATALSLVLLVSLHARNPMLVNGGDSLLRRLLFWSLFLPLGRRWSVDAVRRADDGPSPTRVFGVATAGLCLQPVFVYLVNAAFKLRGSAWPAGRAVRVVLRLDELTVPLGDALAGHPLLLTAATYCWLGLVVASPLLVLATGRLRVGLVGALVGAHLGMALTLRLGLFPLAAVAALLPLLPTRVWDRVEAVAAAGTTTPSSADGSTGRRTARAERDRPGALACVLVLLCCWNAAGLGYVDLPAGASDGLDPQRNSWDMFAPEPRRTGGWYVVAGTLDSGERVDALHGGPVEWARPPDTASTYPGHRWLVYLLSLRHGRFEPMRPAFADFVCSRWHATHVTDLRSVRVTFVSETVRLDGPDRTSRVDLGTYGCSNASRRTRLVG